MKEKKKKLIKAIKNIQDEKVLDYILEFVIMFGSVYDQK